MRNFPFSFFRSCIVFGILRSLLVNKREMTISYLARYLDVTYSQLWKKIIELEKQGFLEKRYIGRVVILNLTGDGKRIAEHVDKIVKILEGKKAWSGR